MTRRPTSGTPQRMRSYLDPDREEKKRKPDQLSTLGLRARLSWIALGIGIVVVAGTVATHTMSQPGPLSAAHARFEQACETCHAPLPSGKPISKMDGLNHRCLDCHDRFLQDGGHTMQAHIRFRHPAIEKTKEWEDLFVCVDCHTEHSGRTAKLTLPQDRICTACHGQIGSGITSFAFDHPEFEVLRAQLRANPDRAKLAEWDAAPLDTDLDAIAAAPIPVFDDREPPMPGLRFNHARHLDEYLPKHPRYKSDREDQRCFRCHTLDALGLDFGPTRFEPGCSASGCHTTESGLLKAEVTEQIPLDLRRLSPDPAVANAVLENPDDGKAVPFLPRLKNLDRAGLAPQWLASVRGDFVEPEDAVEAQGFFTKQIRHADPWILLTVDLLAREAEELARSRGRLTQQGLRDRAADRSAEVFDDPCASRQASEVLPNTGQKQELCSAILALTEEIALLDQQLTPAGSGSQADTTQMGKSVLEGLQASLASLGLEEPHRGRLALAGLRLDQALTGKVLLETPVLDPRREDAARDELRRQLTSLGNVESEWVQREVRALQYKLDQLDEPAPLIAGSGDPQEQLQARRQNLDAERSQLRASVARLSGLGRDCESAFLRLASTALPAASEALQQPVDVDDAIELREQALRLVAKPCLQCHQLGRTPQGRIEFAPIRAQEPGLTAARFVHQPHLRFDGADFRQARNQEGNCASCHAGILKSNQAQPIHFNGINSCRNCHNRTEVADGCQSCHAFHPDPAPTAALQDAFKVCAAPSGQVQR